MKLHLLVFKALFISDSNLTLAFSAFLSCSFEDNLAVTFFPGAVITLIIGPIAAGTAWLLAVISGRGFIGGFVLVV